MIDYKCNRCEENKPHTQEFYSKRSTGMMDTICKICHNVAKEKKRRKKGIGPRTKMSPEEKKVSTRNANLKYELKNKTKVKLSKKKYRDSKKGKAWRLRYNELNCEKNRQRARDYYANHKAECKSRATFRRVQVKHASLSMQFHLETTEVYKLCEKVSEFTGNNFEVDHIIPINHPDICGLHVPWNLQVLIKRSNRYKTNKFDGTYENNSWSKR